MEDFFGLWVWFCFVWCFFSSGFGFLGFCFVVVVSWLVFKYRGTKGGWKNKRSGIKTATCLPYAGSMSESAVLLSSLTYL